MSEKSTTKPVINSPVIKERFFSVFDTKANANRFWNITLYQNGTVVTHFGRQGYDGHFTTYLPGESKSGRAGFDTLIASKTAASHKPSPYIENEVIDAKGRDITISRGSVRSASTIEIVKVVQEQITTSCPVTRSLIKYLVDVNAHDIIEATHGNITYDASTAQFRTTQGVISQSQVNEARNLLRSLGMLVDKGNYGTDFENKMNHYLSLVPQNIGMKRLDPRVFLPNKLAVARQSYILDGLDASFNDVVSAATKTADAKDVPATPKIFNVTLTRLDDVAVRTTVEQAYRKSQNRQHATYGWRIVDIYSVDIAQVRDAFEKYGKPIGNVMRLFHGTKASNLLSILKKGLIIPPAGAAYCCGRLYGDGIYASDQSTKASQYAVGYARGQYRANERRYFMFIVDFAMGKMFTPSRNYQGHYPKYGFDSTFAKGGVSGVINNEMVVYDTKQVNLVYLVEFAER